MDGWQYEDDARAQGYLLAAGLDEAGRGPLAGPVVAAAVILPAGFDAEGVNDSKALTPAARKQLFERVTAEAAYGVGVVEVGDIDRINILQATYAAMRTALASIPGGVDFVFVDGLPVPDLPCPSLAIVDGDAKCISIAAASIIAKVTRDRLMCELDCVYPGYGFAEHKGYYTPQHLAALDRLGACPIHRRSFSPVAERIASCRLPGLD